MPDLQQLRVCPELAPRDAWDYDKSAWVVGEFQRPGGIEVAVQITHFDGVYVYETRYFNRYRITEDPSRSTEQVGATQSASWEELYDDRRCVTVTETFTPVRRNVAKVISQYIEIWLYDSDLRDHYKKYGSLTTGSMVAAGDV